MGKLCALFKVFGLSHIVYMLVGIAIAVVLVFAFRRFGESGQKWTGISLVSLAVLFSILDFVGKVGAVESVAEYLPLNAPHLFAYFCIYLEITKNSRWTKFGYFIVLPIAVSSLVFIPTEYTAYAETSLSVISFVCTNCMLITYSLLRLIWNDEWIEKKDIFNSISNFAIFLASVHIFNVILRFTALGVHANYWGTMGEGFDTVIGLIDKIIPVPFVNLIPLVAVVLGVDFLLILPFDLVKTKKERKNQYEELVALGNLKAQSKHRKAGHSQVLVRGDNKAMPSTPKSSSGYAHKDGFVSINKEVRVNKDTRE